MQVDKRIPLSREDLKALDGKDIFRHPFLDRDVKLMYGPHVTADAGTGLVHTAPGHGYEDFVVGNQYGLQADDAGRRQRRLHQRRMARAERLQGESR